MNEKIFTRSMTFLMMTSILACDPWVTVDHMVENQSSDTILVILKTHESSNTIFEIPPAADHRISFNSWKEEHVRSWYNAYGDSLDFIIADIQKDSVSCKKSWHLKNNWQYKEFDEKTAEFRFVVVDSDF